MNPQATIWIGAFCLGLLGAVLGAWWRSRRLRVQWAPEVQRTLQAQLEAQARTQLQALRDALPAPAEAAPSADLVLSDQALHRVAECVESVLATRLPAFVDRTMADATATSQRAAAEQARALHDALLQHLQQQMPLHIGETLHAGARLHARQLQGQLQSLQSLVEEGLRDVRHAMATAVPVAAAPPADPVLDTSPPLAERLQAQLAAAFGTQREALQQAEDTLRQSLQRVPQWVQQAIQVELEFQARQQAERDTARALEQQRWQAEQDERRMAELRALLQALGAQPPAMASSAPEPKRPCVPVPGAPVRPPAVVSARPPEVELTPLPRPEPAREPEVAEPELSDEELDALPPDLPVPGKTRKRGMPPPKKPPLHSL